MLSKTLNNLDILIISENILKTRGMEEFSSSCVKEEFHECLISASLALEQPKKTGQYSQEQANLFQQLGLLGFKCFSETNFTIHLWQSFISLYKQQISSSYRNVSSELHTNERQINRTRLSFLHATILLFF